MKTVEFEDGAVQIDAAVVASGLGLAPESLLAGMRDGKVTSLSETGVGDDAGLFRLTFFCANRRLRLVVDGSGIIVRQSAIDFGDRALPAPIRAGG